MVLSVVDLASSLGVPLGLLWNAGRRGQSTPPTVKAPVTASAKQGGGHSVRMPCGHRLDIRRFQGSTAMQHWSSMAILDTNRG